MSGFPLMPAVLAAWIPLTVAAFRLLGPRLGTLVAVVGGHIGLPGLTPLARFTSTGRLADLPAPYALVRPAEGVWLELGKPQVIGLGVLAALVVTQWADVRRWRPSWWDLGALLFVAAPLTGLAVAAPAARLDPLGLAVQRLLAWAPIYTAGRLYFADTPGRRQLAAAVIVSGLLLAVIALGEQAAGPDRFLVSLLYNAQPPSFFVERQGGWRPTGLMGDGISLSNWLAIAAVTALLAWEGRWWRPARGPAWWPALVLIGATLAARGMYAQIYLAVGIVAVLLRRMRADRLVLVGLLLCVPLYMGLRATKVIDRDRTSSHPWVQALGKSRSLFVRLRDEDFVMEGLARHTPWLGFGAEFGHAWLVAPDVNVKYGDGLWVHEAFAGGWLGLLVYYGVVHFMPIGLTLRRRGSDDDDGVAMALALASALFMLDGLHNPTLPVPVMLMAGALVSRAVVVPGRRGSERDEPSRRVDREAAHAEAGPAAGGAVPESVPIVAGLAAVLVLLAVPLARPVPGLASAAVALMFGLAGWAGSWALTRFGVARAAMFAAVFAALGLHFNLMRNPTPAALTTLDLFQALAMIGLAAGLVDRLAGGRTWISVALAAVPMALAYILADASAGRGGAGLTTLFRYELPALVGPRRGMLSSGVWLLLGVLGIAAARESWGVNLAAGLLLGSAGGALAMAHRAEIPAGLDAALLACAAVGLGFAAAGLLAPHAARRPLRRLGRYWLLVTILAGALSPMASGPGASIDPVAGAFVSAAALALAWLSARLLDAWHASFRRWPPWLYLLGAIPMLQLIPDLPPSAVATISGLLALGLGAQYGGLASCVARFPLSRKSDARS